MKLKNKKTGEIMEFRYLQSDHVAPLVLTTYKNDKPEMYSYTSLAELNEEWEDYEEPKEYWWIDTGSIPMVRKSNNPILSTAEDIDKEIGNYFETKEEAEKAVEKLETLTKLCKKGFEFNSVEMFGSGFIKIEASIPISEKTTLQERSDITDGLYLLFGGGE